MVFIYVNRFIFDCAFAKQNCRGQPNSKILSCVIICFCVFIPQCIEIIGLKFSGIADICNTVIEKTNLQLVMGFSGYFVLGHLLNKANISKRREILIYVAGVCGAIFTILSTAIISKVQQSPTLMLYSYFSVNVLLMATAVFVFAKKHLNKLPKTEKRLNILLYFSKCSLGVYLVHVFIIEALQEIFNITTLSFDVILSVPLISVLVFLISMMISIILNRIPIIKKWLI